MSILYKGFDWLADDIRVILVDEGQYTPSDAHGSLSDIPAGARVAVSAAMTGKTLVSGVHDADDVNFPTVSGLTIEGAAIYSHTTSRLIAYLTDVDLIPNGGGVTLQWSNGAAKIFSSVTS